jgi:hypothetical protein
MVALPVLVMAGKQGAHGVQPVFRIAGPSLNAGYQLPHYPLFTGSDSVFHKGALLLRNSDYAVDYAKGLVFFSKSWGPSDTMDIYYIAVPFALPGRIVYLPLQDTGSLSSKDQRLQTSAAARPSRPIDDWRYDQNGSISFGGSKSLSITAGSGRDISLDQALDISLNGKLGPGLEVDAVLSDQGLPLSAAGATQELSQIDKVYLKARGSNWETVLGDYQLNYRGTAYYRLDRQLQGASVRFSEKRFLIAASAATSKGQKSTYAFTGIEGLQGPYKLAVPGIGGTVQVLPGSEKVWLDGVELKRGELQDYVIDYQSGTISFNPNRPVHGDTRIMTEFEYAGHAYSRTFYSFSTETKISDLLLFKGAYMQEGDDSDKPLFMSLTDNDKLRLSQAGDDTSALWVDGGVAVDSGKGSYFLRDSIYVYAGSDSGDQQVTFTWVGTGKGQYRDSLGIFVYAGAGGGDYSAIRKLSAPAVYRLYTTGAELSWEGGKTLLEGAFCDHDRNLFSTTGDDDNRGLAASGRVQWKRDSLPFGGFELRAAFSGLDSYFDRSLLPADPGFVERWQLGAWQGAPSLGQQQLLRFGDGYLSAGPEWARLSGEWGRLEMDRGRWGRKYISGMTSRIAPSLEIRYRYRRDDLGNAWNEAPSLGRRDDHYAEAGLKMGRWSCQTSGNANNGMISLTGGPSWGHRYYLGSIGAGWKGNHLSWAGKATRREDYARDSLAGLLEASSYTQDLSNSLALASGSGINSSLYHTFRRLAYRPGFTGVTLNTHLGVFEAGYSKPSSPVRASLNYRLGTSEAIQKKETYILVPASTGDYSYDPVTGNFYPDTSGSYLKKIEEEGEGTIATESSARAYFLFAPDQPGAKGINPMLKLEFSGSAGIKTDRTPSLPLLAFDQGYWWDRVHNFSSYLDLSGDGWIYPYSQGSLRIHLRYKRDDDNQYSNHHFTRWIREQRGEYSTIIGSLARFMLYGERSETSSLSPELGLESQNLASRLGAEHHQQLGRLLSCGLKPSAAREDLLRLTSVLGTTKVQFIEFNATPYLNRQFRREGNLRIETSHTYRQADREPQAIPLEFSYNRPLGVTHSWKMAFDYRINSYLASALVYDARKEPGRKVIHNARAEMRAYF